MVKIMWTVVFVTNNHELADMLKLNLLKKDILSRIKISENSDESNAECIQVLVPYGDVDEALNFIIDLDI